jgi:hypothetical protein
LSFFARNEVFIYGVDRQVNGHCRQSQNIIDGLWKGT